MFLQAFGSIGTPIIYSERIAAVFVSLSTPRQPLKAVEAIASPGTGLILRDEDLVYAAYGPVAQLVRAHA